MNYILIGFKNSGKTTLGKQLSEQLNYHFIDTDDIILDLIREYTGEHITIPEYYTECGEDAFRQIESEAINSLHGVDKCVIATGGGAVIDSGNVRVLKGLGKLIYLKCDKDILAERFINDSLTAMKKLDFDTLWKLRIPTYESVADSIIEDITDLKVTYG